MANTIYTEIYTVFQSQLRDPVFNASTVRDDLSKQYLINSIPKFRKCLQDLSNRTDSSDTFNIELTDDEIQILANLMIIEYLSPQIVNLELIQQGFNNKEFSRTSQAAHLEKLLLLRKDRKKDVSKMIMDYLFHFSDLTTLKSTT